MTLKVKDFLNSKFLIPFFLWVLLSLRIYPESLIKSLLHSGKIFIGCGLYGLGLTIIFNGLLAKVIKKSLTREQFIKTVLWLAVITAIGASLEYYFHIGSLRK